MVLRKSIVQAIYLKPTSREAKLKNSIIRVLTPITAVLMLVAALPQAQAASKYPDGTIRLLVPYGAGGGTDLSARLIASGLKKTLNATVVVENMPAASGQTALQTLADAEPDGYTLALASLPATNMMYLDKVRGATFSLKSFSIIGLHDNDPTGIAVSATSPYKTLADVVAAAKRIEDSAILNHHRRNAYRPNDRNEDPWNDQEDEPNVGADRDDNSHDQKREQLRCDAADQRSDR